MNNLNLREKRTHGTENFRFSIEEVFSKNHSSPFSPLHFHSEFEFCVVDEGEMNVQINEKSVTLSKGEGVFVNSDTLHSILPKEEAFGHMIIMMFDADFVAGEKEVIRTKYVTPLINGEISVPEKLSAEEVRLILKAEEMYKKGNSTFELEMKSCALKLISILINRPPFIDSKNPGKNAETVKKAIEYIHENYTSTITLSQIADFVYVTPEHLCRVFSRFTDESPFEYLNRYRIIKSSEMLLESGLPVSEIASRAGFNSSSYYNKIFLRYTGRTPTQYRKENKRI